MTELLAGALAAVKLCSSTELDFDIWVHPMSGFVVLTSCTHKTRCLDTDSLRAREMLSFHHGNEGFERDDTFWITGRGMVFTFEHNPAPELWDPGMLVNQWVLINGGLFFILGVETFRSCISPTNPYGDRSIGILIRSQTNLPVSYHDRDLR